MHEDTEVEQGKPSKQKLQTFLTVSAAGIATGVAITGMWRVFGDALRITSTEGKIALCAFLEIALLASALRARGNLRATGSVGVDGAAVWVMAVLSGVFSAWDQDGWLAKSVRLAAPLVAAFLWERGLAAERKAARGGRRISWRLTPARVAVRLGLAEPDERTAGDVDRARQLARLTRLRLRLDALRRPATYPGWVAGLTFRQARLAVAQWRWERQRLAAIERLGLGIERHVADRIAATVKAVVLLDAATDPANFTATPPLALPPVARQETATPPASGVPAVADRPATPTATRPATVAAQGAPARRPVAVTESAVADMSVADQVAWFARQLDRHPGRTVADWVAQTGLAKRTVERRISAARDLSAGAETAEASGS